ncbi:protein-tyrosine sulfotransferase 1 [Caerostris darwini]|uniref:Protein-tyrosine sulfotransferase n=1 Tax=Caerostris darwini TaxID=1538125 RepID=A0AAV4WDG7_9ARAC|nr:protein-tyrosine sulfotransferase 1 [Caerostris darwini]
MDLHDYRQCLRRWTTAVQAMYNQCHLLGPRICLPVHYERLVLHPEPTMRMVLSFLDIPWNNSVLHHELLVGKQGGVSLSMQVDIFNSEFMLISAKNGPILQKF